MNKANATRREPLDRGAIVTAGVALADSEGVGALTMRRLADDIGFKAMALYNHVASKDEVLALMVDQVAAEVGEPFGDEEPLRQVRAWAIATRQAFVRHPWAPELWLKYVPGPARLDQMEALLHILAVSGLSPDIAHHGFHAVNNHVIGYTLQELAMGFDASDTDDQAVAEEYLAGLSPAEHPRTIAHIHEHLDGNTASSFELVLDLILDGLRRLEAGAPD